LQGISENERALGVSIVSFDSKDVLLSKMSNVIFFVIPIRYPPKYHGEIFKIKTCFNFYGQLNDETLPNFIERKAPKKGREKETRGKDQSSGPTKAGHKEEREPLRTGPSTSGMKQID
jgi:hypothetical protein